MDKILSAAQTRAADRYTIEHEPISSLDLMERASRAFVDCLEHHLNDKPSFHVVCGPGNNGEMALPLPEYSLGKVIKYSAAL